MERPWIWWSLLETGERPGVEPSEALDNARTEHRLGHSGGADIDVSGAPENGSMADTLWIPASSPKLPTIGPQPLICPLGMSRLVKSGSQVGE